MSKSATANRAAKNGDVTKEGITADLEWMKRVGIAGMQMFDGSLGVPLFVEKRLVWMTPDWKDALRHAAQEADRLGLEFEAGGRHRSLGDVRVTAEAFLLLTKRLELTAQR